MLFWACHWEKRRDESPPVRTTEVNLMVCHAVNALCQVTDKRDETVKSAEGFHENNVHMDRCWSAVLIWL